MYQSFAHFNDFWFSVSKSELAHKYFGYFNKPLPIPQRLNIVHTFVEQWRQQMCYRHQDISRMIDYRSAIDYVIICEQTIVPILMGDNGCNCKYLVVRTVQSSAEMYRRIPGSLRISIVSLGANSIWVPLVTQLTCSHPSNMNSMKLVIPLSSL